MLELKNIKKDYKMQDETVQALKGINLKFRKSEFVSILGQSGCGKTTLLNIIGGLDKYTSGDLIINGKSTKEFKDVDWDTYRNNSIGFVFQSYNLIPHQTVLQNVELALTLSGVSREERKKRAIEVLDRVGLKSKINMKPNQLSGGQMQRVAIARALVNNPDIILADEPTGALDSKTSVQIMDILKEISKDKLIIMVTHNPDLANEYSSRIIKLLDGEVVDDSNPFVREIEDTVERTEEVKTEIKKEKKKKTSMSFFTALSLSLKNLLTKKARTIIVAFAGSIGIIGIALILAISSGFQGYIDRVQKDTLSNYPLTISESNYNMASLMQIFLSRDENVNNAGDKVYVKNELEEMLNKFNNSSSQNDLKSFKYYIENDGKEELASYTTAIQYVYDVNINAYFSSDENGLIAVNPTTVFADVISSYPTANLTTPDKMIRYQLLNYMFGSSSSYFSNEFWEEMLDSDDLLASQYELVGENSKWASSYDEIMLVVDENNQISDYTLYGLGLLNQDDLYTLLDDYINNINSEIVDRNIEFEDILKLDYRLILESSYYEKQEDGTFLDVRTLKDSNNELYKQKLQALYDDAIKIKVAGIIKEKKDVSAHSIKSTIGYKKELTQHIIAKTLESEVVQLQMESNIDVLTGKTLLEEHKTKESILKLLGYVDESSPSNINIYPINFDVKDKIESFIKNYNDMCIKNGEEDKIITYSDLVGTMMSSVSTIISAITYVLVAFVAVSLIVSSIMIGIITYISVLERIKEIGILRSIGASKKDIKRVFTAESSIIGFTAGVMGIIITLILIIPINIIINSLAGISGVASLPAFSAIVLIAISVGLTLIAGLFPARIASKKDPVIALRTE